MPDFNLSDEDIHKLKHRFSLFQRERKIIHGLLSNYVADYRQFEGSAGKRYEYLRKKYISRSPDLTHLIFNDGNIQWSVYDISIVLGRHLTSIIRSIKKMENTESWCVRLLSLRENVKNANGRIIQVYQKEIFDLLLDLYEDEYLLRFSEPRRGSQDSAPDIKEVRNFWQYLKDMESFTDYSLYSHKNSLPDIPAMNWKDIIALMWEKVFNVRIWTVVSVIFAVCFEIAHRFLGISLWFAFVPAIISVVCVFLVHSRYIRFTPSSIGAGAFLFTLMWIPACLSGEAQKEEPMIYLTPIYSEGNVYFSIKSNVEVKEYYYRIKPKEEFCSLGLQRKINPQNNQPYPEHIIQNSRLEGIADIDIKYMDFHGNESKVWNYSFDLEAEGFNLRKKIILNLDVNWVGITQTSFDRRVRVFFHPDLLYYQWRDVIESVVYGINTKNPATKIEFEHFISLNDRVFDPYLILSVDMDDNYIEFVSSYLVFKDGSSSDIRISRIN